MLTPPGARITTFSALRNRDYRWYWLGMVAGFGALQMQVLARGWLVYDMTGSAFALGLVTAAWGMVLILFSPIGGAVADRVDKRNLLIVTQLAWAAVNLIIAVLISTGVIALWHLIVSSLFTGAVFAFQGPGRQAIIAELVGERELMNAIALNSSAMGLMRVVAPAAAGVLVAVIGIDGVYYITLVLYLLAVAALLMVPIAGITASRSNASVTAELVEGVNYVRRAPIILTLLSMSIVLAVFAMPYVYLMPVFAVDVLDVGASGLGWLMAAAGVGGLAGSLAIASLGDFRGKGRLTLGMGLGCGIAIILFSLSRSLSLSLIILVALGIASTGFMAVNNTLIQSNVSHQVRGRVMSIYMMGIGMMPIGALPVSAVAEAWGVPLALGACGAIVTLFTLAIAAALPSLRRLE